MGPSLGVKVLHSICLSHVIGKIRTNNIIPNQVDCAKNVSFLSKGNTRMRPERGFVEGLLVLFLLKTALLLHGRTIELRPFNFL